MTTLTPRGLRTLIVTITLGLFFCLTFAAPRAALAADAPPDKAEAKAVIPVFRFDSDLTEAPAGESLPLFGEPGVTLREVVERMDKAATDPAVKAAVVMVEGGGFGLGQAEELRRAIDRLRAAGKDVYAHTDSTSLHHYSLLAGATRLSASPTADIWLVGLHGEQPYLRGLLDKLGVQPDYLTCGDYKSAGELFMRTGPSPQADQMMNWLLDGLYQDKLDLIATGRKLPQDKVREIIDRGMFNADSAKAAGLVDAVEHRQDFERFLRDKYGRGGAGVTFDRKYGQKKSPQLDLTSPFGLMKFMGEMMGAGAKKPKSDKPAVAIVYVNGPIVVGRGEGFNPLAMGGPVAASTPIRKALGEAARDDSIKAVVLRVDSPGGSAVASEIILDATKRIKAKKPFIVSMGDVAGSGGYYVSLGADTIFADESTITASIGVVAGKFVTNGMWDKVGITFKAYERGKSAGLLASDRPFSPGERERIQSWMDGVYDTFKSHVTESRGKRLKKPLDDLAGGRVFTGRQALELGLIDRIGTLHDAIDAVAAQARLKPGEYEVRTVPEPKNPLQAVMAALTGESPDDDEPNGLLSSDGPRPSAALPVALRGPSLIDLAAPQLEHLDPQRVRAAKAALLRMELLQREGVLLAAPEMVIGN
jgi:protease-4